MSTKEEIVAVPLEILLLNDLFRKRTLDQNIYDMDKKKIIAEAKTKDNSSTETSAW